MFAAAPLRGSGSRPSVSVAVISHCSAIPIMRSCGLSSLRPRAKARSDAAVSKPLASYMQSRITTSCFGMYCSKTRYKYVSREVLSLPPHFQLKRRGCVFRHTPPRHQFHVLLFGHMFCHPHSTHPTTHTIARSRKRAMVRTPTNAPSHTR
jgi:hypothetical protein